MSIRSEVERLGGAIQFDDQGRVDWVELGYANVTDGDLEFLEDESASVISYLSLAKTQVTDSALCCLQNLGALGELDLRETQVTGACFGYLRSDSLSTVTLNGCRCLTVEGMAKLCSQDSIRRLNLKDTNAHDSFLVEVAKLSHLERLNLNGSEVTDAGLQNLSNSCALRLLTFNETCATQAGFDRLRATIPKLSRGLTM